MKRKLTLGISPCPNDTYIFGALVQGLIDTEFEFTTTLEDVQDLNLWAGAGEPDVCKVSVAAAAGLLDEYLVLNCGGALGRGVGPLLVAGSHTDISGLDGGNIALPGTGTTASLLMGLLAKDAGIKFTPQQMVFDQVMGRVSEGAADAGVIIHEGRFTYERAGLVKLADLGQWWEEKFDMPLPLGVIVARRELGDAVLGRVELAIRQSLDHADKKRGDIESFIRDNAQELVPEVIDSHIRTFVTEYSRDIGPEGRAAIMTLFREARPGTEFTEPVFV